MNHLTTEWIKLPWSLCQRLAALDSKLGGSVAKAERAGFELMTVAVQPWQPSCSWGMARSSGGILQNESRGASSVEKGLEGGGLEES